MSGDIASIVSQFDPRLALLLGWVILASKALVDWLKTTTPMPKYGPPLASFIVSLILIIILMYALAIPVDGQLLAQSFILSIVSAAGAITVTSLQARTQPSTDTKTADVLADEIVERIEAKIQAARTEADTVPVPPSLIRRAAND